MTIERRFLCHRDICATLMAPNASAAIPASRHASISRFPHTQLQRPQSLHRNLDAPRCLSRDPYLQLVSQVLDAAPLPAIPHRSRLQRISQRPGAVRRRQIIGGSRGALRDTALAPLAEPFGVRGATPVRARTAPRARAPFRRTTPVGGAAKRGSPCLLGRPQSGRRPEGHLWR